MRWQLVVLGAWLTACGTDEAKPAHMPGTVDATNARTSVENVFSLEAAMASSNGADAVTAVEHTLFADLYIVMPTIYPVYTTTANGALTGTENCDAQNCTFDVSYEETYSIARLNGTLTRDAGTGAMAWSLSSMDINKVSMSNWNISGDLILSPDTLDGTMSLTGHDQRMGSWHVSVRYDAVQVDEQHCPVGGSVYVVSTYLMFDATAYWDLDGRVTFGPGCGG